MPTVVQLRAEPWFGAEIQPASLAKLCADLREHFGVPANYIGSKGDENHLRGYHRSRAWVLKSKYCTSRAYSVTETAGNRNGGDDNWLAAVDFQPRSTDELLLVCQRLDAAVRAGRLEKITEWYGNVDGDQRVDGYNNIANRVATSDSSHLWHLHMSFDRGRVGEDHSDVFAVLTGQEDDMQQYFIGHDGSDDTYWLCDGMFARGPLTRPPARDEIGDIKQLASEGMFALWKGGEIREGMVSAFGLRIPWSGAGGQADPKAIATATADELAQRLKN